MVKGVMLRCGVITVERLLEHEDGFSIGRQCECGGAFVGKKKQAKTIRTVVGEVHKVRRYQQCNRCKRWRIPEDMVLDVVGTGFSPGLRRMMAKTGAEVCFDKARDFIFEFAGVRVTDKDVERVSEAVGEDIAAREQQKGEAFLRGEQRECSEDCSTLYFAADGTGVPVVRRETLGRVGKHEDGLARTREAKLGAVFSQTAFDEKGRPLRDPFSTTYIGKVEGSEEFGYRLYAEAERRGFQEAKRVVMIGDGAPWIWNLAEEHFPGAIQLLDYYHAAEHLGTLAKALFPEGNKNRKPWLKALTKKLWKGETDSLIAHLRKLDVRGRKKKETDKTIAFFEKHRHRMRYKEFRKAGLFIGSGVVEAGCKSLIGGRLKCSGMHWTVRGANAIIALKCCIESGAFEQYWESRRAA